MEILQELIPYIVPALAIIIGYAVKRWTGIIVGNAKIESLLYFIVNIITDTEQKNPKMKGLDKQKMVVSKVKKELPAKDISFLEKTFKTVDVAVEKAFQLSHLASPFVRLFKK